MTEPITASASRVRQVEAIANGTVIDHIPPAMTLKVAALLTGSEDQVFIGANLRSSRMGRKGVVKISNREISPHEASCLALIAPTATVCIIREFAVVTKQPVPVPERFDDVARCANPNCVTNHERWPTRFVVVRGPGRERSAASVEVPLRVRCVYCERGFAAGELALLDR